jgi:hypothetical protein
MLLVKKAAVGLVAAAVMSTGGLVAAGAVAAPHSHHNRGRAHLHATAKVHAPKAKTAASSSHRGRRGSIVDGTRPFRAAARAIGVSTGAVYQAFLHGESIAAFARAHGVDPARVIAALEAAGLRSDHHLLAAGDVVRYGKHPVDIAALASRIVDGEHGSLFHHAHVKRAAHAAAAKH